MGDFGERDIAQVRVRVEAASPWIQELAGC